MRAKETVFTIPDKDGIPITLTRERWESHILVGHPAMAKHLEAIKLTISDPDYILQSDKRPIPNCSIALELLRGNIPISMW